MNRILLFILFLTISSNIYSQESGTEVDSTKHTKRGTITTRRVVSSRIERKRDSDFNVNIIYEKETGRKISPQEFKEILKKKSNIRLAPVHNEKGEVEKYILDADSNNHDSGFPMNYNQIPKEGEVFPDFEFHTIDNKKIKLSELVWKTVILRCEFSPVGPGFRKEEIKDIEEKISKLGDHSDIQLIVIFRSSGDEILAGLDIDNYHATFVPNGMGFFIRNNIKRFPSTIVIDKQKKLVGTYYHSKAIDFQKIVQLTN